MIKLRKAIKVSEAAKILHVSPQTVRDWTNQGKIKSVISAGGHRTYDELEIRIFSYLERGIKTYWTASVSFRLKDVNQIEYLSEDSQTYTAKVSNALIKEEPLVGKSLSYLGKQLLVTGDYAALTPNVEDNPNFEFTPAFAVSDGDGVKLSSFIEVAAFSKEKAVETVRKLLPSSIKSFKENNLPAYGVTGWKTTTGEEYPLY